MAPQNLIQALSDNYVGVRLGTKKLTNCKSVKTLGIVLDRDLTLSGQILYPASPWTSEGYIKI